MIADLKPYETYRDSELPWLGQIPSHWQVKRAKSVLLAIDRRSKTGTEELLTVSSAKGVVLRSTAKVTMFKAKSYVGYKLCWPGDLAINSLWAWGGGLGVSKHHGIISTAYGVYRVRHDAAYNPRYLDALVRSRPFNWELKLRSKGIWISRLQLTDESFLNSPLPILPSDEQELIVRFLDWANVRLGKAIAAKRKVIGLLEEQKQAIIHRAVTRGLDDSVPLKPSGLDWLGDVPEHWSIVRIKNLLSAIDYGTSENARGEGAIRVLNMGHVKNGRVTIPAKGSLHGMPKGLALRKHDLLFNRTNSPELVGKVGIFLGEETDNVTFASYLVRLRPKAEHDPFWLNYALNSDGFWHYARRQAFVSLHQANLNSTRYSQMAIPVPPPSEQRMIADSMKAETKSFEDAIIVNEREIELFREYRTRLIADVVTGKLDVREFARTLPADIAEEAAELASSELGDEQFSDADDDLADELTGEPA